jgi:hypothetical protein
LTGAVGGFNTKGTLTLDSAISPALFVGYESLYFGVLYQMNTYKVTASDVAGPIDIADNTTADPSASGASAFTSTIDHDSSKADIGTAIKVGDVEENQMLFGFKALHPQEFGEFSVTLSAEAFTNFGADTEDDMVTHWKSLVSQLPSMNMTGNLEAAHDGTTLSHPEQTLIGASGHKQSAANTFYYRLGVSAAIEFASL